MVEKVTFGDLRQLLTDCDFQRSPVNGPYVLFKHEPAGALQAFRGHRINEIADLMDVFSVRKTLVGFGFMEEKEFEQVLQKAVARRKAKAARKKTKGVIHAKRN